MKRYPILRGATFGVLGVLGGLVAFSAVSQATTLTSLNVPITGSVVETARKVAVRYADGLSIPAQELVWQRSLSLRAGAVVYFTQQHQGLPVLGARLAVTALNGKVVALSGSLVPGLPSAPMPTSLLSRSEAVSRLETTLPLSHVRRASLAYSAGKPWGPRPVWVMQVLRQQPFQLLQMVVDAQTGAVLYGRPAMKQALGQVYQSNPVTSSLATLELSGLTSEEMLQGEHSDVQSCSLAENGYDLNCDRYAQPDENGNYIYQPSDPDLVDPFAEVQAYYHVDLIHRWMNETFGFSRKDSQQIRTIVNFAYSYGGDTYGYPNAFLGDIDGDGHGDLVLGQEDDQYGVADFAYDGDVIYHEFTHSVVEETSGLDIDIDSLGLNVMPLALNEGFADLFSSILAGDPTIGEYVGGASGIRSLVGDAACPDYIDGESHNDGQIWGQANWTARTQASDQDAFDQILYATMAGLGQFADFGEAGQLMKQVAQELEPDILPTLESEFSTRGMQTCSRIISLKAGDRKRGDLYGQNSFWGMSVVPAAVQYKIEVPQRAKTLRLTVGSHHNWGDAVIGAFVRKDQPVDFGYSKSVYDFVKTGDMEELVMGEGGTVPLEPGETLYVLPVNDGDSDAYFSISYEVDLMPLLPQPPEELPTQSATGLSYDSGVEPLTPDAGLPADQGGLQANPEPKESGGCAVASGTEGRPSSLALLLAVFGLLLFRTRRQG